MSEQRKQRLDAINSLPTREERTRARLEFIEEELNVRKTSKN